MDYTINIDGSTICIELSGELTFESHEDFREILQCITPDAEKIIVSLKNITQMDSTGVGMLKLAQDKAKKVSTSLKFTEIPDDFKIFIELLN